MKVWLLQTGEPLPSDPGNPRPMRAMNLANALVQAGHNVVLWSSTFNHQEKRHRGHGPQRIVVSPNLEIRLLPSPGYRRNIGPGRLWDHAALGFALKKRLKEESVLPDVAFVGYPPIETAAVMTRWLSRRGVPCLLDVKDQWPSVFTKVFPFLLQPLAAIAFLPYYYLGRRAMRDATGITAMADPFLKWALTFSNRLPNEADRIVSLTTPTGQIPVADLQEARKWWDAKGILADGRGRVCFVGSHSRAFDMSAVAEAAHELAAQGTPCEFVLCGDGELTTEWRRLMSGAATVVFAGWVSRPQVEALAERSMAALAPYYSTGSFVMSVPNKIIDAFALGLPILSPLEGEVRRLIALHHVGWSYGSGTGTSLAQCLRRLLADSALRQEASSNALRLYRDAFSFDRVYGGLVQHLESLVQEHREQVARGRSRQDAARR